MPVRDGERYLLEAMTSILSQTMSDLELLVVDDGSVDASAEIARSTGDPRVRLLQGERRGEGAARNVGLDHARGRWIAWHDADDIALPRRLEALLAAVEGGADFAHSDMLFVDADKRATGYLRSSAMPRASVLPFLLREGTPYNNPTMLIRRAVVSELRFDESLVVGVDSDFVRRFAPHVDGAHVPEPLTLYRRHAESISAGAGPDQHWPHVQRMVEEEALDVLVPEAFREYSGDRAIPVAQAFVAFHLFKRGYHSAAVAWFGQALSYPSDEGTAPLIAALVSLAQGDAAAAERCARAGRRTAMALSLLGELAARRGAFDEAADSYADALSVDEESYDAVAGLRATGELLGLRVVDDPRRRLVGVGEH